MPALALVPVTLPRMSRFFLCVAAWVAVLALAAHARAAADRFQELVNRLPRSTNAVAIFNLQKAEQSASGVRQGWRAKIDRAFEAGQVRVPPQATRFVLAAEIDLEFLEPIWEAAVLDLEQDVSMEQIAASRGGTLDRIENLPAVALPNDTYLVQFGPKTLGAMGPAKRQAVVRWIRETRDGSQPPLSPYLQKAAAYSDKAGSEIIMAIDLDGALSPERVVKYLKSKQPLLDQWKADLPALAKLLSGTQGLRIGVRIGEQQVSGAVAVDLRGDASGIQSYAKPLLLQVLADLGASLGDVQTWTVQAKPNEIALAGKLTSDGLRRLFSVVQSPASAVGAPLAKPPETISPGELSGLQSKASLEHFRTVTAMFDDLKKDMRDSKNLASTALWFDKYAKKIARLPILNVDEELLKYSAFVGNSMRQAAGAVRTMGVQSNARQSQIISSPAGYGYAGYRYGAYGWYGGYGGSAVVPLYDPVAEARGIAAERRVVRAEEKATMATDVHQIRDAVVAATADVRRKMTEKYRLEF